MEITLAVDIGTSKVSAAVYVHNRFFPLVFPDMLPYVPAVIAITSQEQMLIGNAALKQASLNPQYTYFSLFRFLDQNLNLIRIQEDLNRLPYSIGMTAQGKQYITTAQGKNYSLEHLLAKLIDFVRMRAEKLFAMPIKNALVIIPPMISHNKKLSLVRLFEKAKLTISEFIESPVAAGIAFAYRFPQPQLITLLDIGAGSLKVSTIQIRGKKEIEVLNTTGYEDICGEDFTTAITDWLEGECREQTKIKPDSDATFKVRIREAAEANKLILSSKEKAFIRIPYLIVQKSMTPSHLEVTLTREQYERFTNGLITSITQKLEKSVKAAQLQPKDIEKLVLLGGQSQMPALQRTLYALYKQNVCIDCVSDNLALWGAAYKSAADSSGLIITQKKLIQLDKLQSGSILANRFEVRDLLGTGGFSYIYGVKDRQDNGIYALKILKPEFNNDKEIRERFIVSANLAFKANHPTVVETYELIDTPAVLAVRMELLEGWPLETFITSERFDHLRLDYQLQVALEILEGMSHLKSINMYHGDLKPDNIWITKERHAKLLDFELARYADGNAIIQAKVTGTPRYMSPEHLSAQSPFGDWSEIYSFGLILYRSFTNEFPRKEGTPSQEYLIFDFSISEPIDPCKINPKLPREIGNIILKCIKRRRSERYQTFEEVTEALKSVKEITCMQALKGK